MARAEHRPSGRPPRVATFGASVRGPRNAREGGPNQDAWVRGTGRFGHVVAVADGLGSRTESHLGARAACRAVMQAVKLWPGVRTGADVRHLLRLVEIIWRLAVDPAASERASTCCFCLREPDGHLLVAGLGDGLALLRHVEGSVQALGGRAPGDFGNETLALGAAHRLTDWWTHLEQPGTGRAILLATDGVADDLRPERHAGLMEWIVEDVTLLPGAARWRCLERELRDWPVPHHQDDKTLAALVEPPETEPS